MDDYSKVLWLEGIPDMEKAVKAWVDVLRTNGANAIANKVWTTWIAWMADMEKFAASWAAEATKMLRETEQKTRVRPDTGGQGGPRIMDYLQADPIPALPGTVGIANESVLDANVYGVWLPNEIGSSGRVGAQLHGYFLDGQGGGEEIGFHAGFAPGFSPDPSMFREHPLFQVMPWGPPMNIHNPIPDRRFILKTIEQMEPRWHAGVRALRLDLKVKFDALRVEYDALRAERAVAAARAGSALRLED